MFSNVFVAEQTQVLKRRLFWLSLAALAGLMVLIFVGSYVTYETQPDEREIDFMLWPAAPVAIFEMTTQIGVLILAVLVGAPVAQSSSWRTMHLWLSRGVPRTVLMLAKFGALLLPVLAIVLTALVAGGIATTFITLQINGTVSFSQIDMVQLALSVLRTGYTLLPYAALTLLLAVVSRSTAGTIGVVVAYNLLVESLLPLSILKYLPAGLASSVRALNQMVVQGAAPNAEAASQLFSVGQASIGIALYTLMLLVVALWAFRRQDLTE
jgi:ABC-type transport system involved in multi-copper enzyme maturation permease subunit